MAGDGNIALEHRPQDGHELYFRINYNEFTDEEERQLTDLEFGRGTLTNQTATSGSFSQGRASKEFRDYKQNHLIDANHGRGAYLERDEVHQGLRDISSLGPELSRPFRGLQELGTSGFAPHLPSGLGGNDLVLAVRRQRGERHRRHCGGLVLTGRF